MAKTKSLPKRRGPMRRRAVVSTEEMVRVEPLYPDEKLPLLAEPNTPGVDVGHWLAGRREKIEAKLSDHGGILLRGFDLDGPAAFEELVRRYSGEPLEYSYRSTPRREVEGRVYTSTEYPADQSIPLHNEMSYTASWPLKIWFCCLIPAQEGGETPIADSRRVYQAVDPDLRRRFEERGVLYVRNYGGGLDLSWQEVFQTDDRAEVERFCDAHGIELEWRGDDALRTRQVAQATTHHPKTGEPVWFNQAHLFHVSGLPPAVRDPLLDLYGEEGLPRNAYYGDGSPIEESALDQIRGVYRDLEVTFPWRQGDVLLLDNVLTAHGRRPYAGQRKVVVSMAEPAQ